MTVNRVLYQISTLPGDRIYQLKEKEILDRIQAQARWPIRERVLEAASYVVPRVITGGLAHHAWTQNEGWHDDR